MIKKILILAAVGFLGGCAMGGGSFACQAPDGVNCNSISGVYSNSMQGNLPSQKKGEDEEPAEKVETRRGYVLTTPTTGTPIRSKPTVLRIWLAPWQDDDGDFRDNSFIFVQTDNGRWVMEESLRRITKEFKPQPPQQQKQEKAAK